MLHCTWAFAHIVPHIQYSDKYFINNFSMIFYTDVEDRLRLSKSLLNEALKYGFVESRTVVCLLFGVPGAGKTHTKHLLFRWVPPEFRNSTPLAARPIQAIRVRACTQGGQLQEIDPDQLDQILADTVAKGGVSLKKKSFLGRNPTVSKGITPPPPSLDTIEHPFHLHDAYVSLFSTYPSKLQALINSSLNQTAYRIATTSAPQQYLSGDWIYLIDCGGQIEFLQILPAFLQHTSICLFITKLFEMLSEHPKIEYFEDGRLLGEPILCPFTNEEMFLHCAQTVQTQYTHHDGTANQGSKLLMVGTHIDLEHYCSESREEKNQRLQSMLCPDFEQSLVFHGQNMNEVIFPINAKNPGPHDHQVASEITKVIFDVVSGLEPRKTPISWFKLEQFLQNLARDDGERVLHWKECLQVARSLHISKKDLNAALDHLASFGVIHYYPHLLPNIVFVGPQILLNKISELVKYHYRLRYGSQPPTIIHGEWRKFANEGCITLKLLKQFPEHYTDFFTPDDFLKLMNDRLIVTQFIGSNEYFMPCLLRTMESQEIDQYRVTSFTSGVAPLAIHFSCKLVPHGVFCSLVTFLRSQFHPWSLSLCPEDRTKPLCLTRNCIKFQLPEYAPGSLTLIDAFSHFELHINTRQDVCVHLCPSIWQTLAEGIQIAAKTLKYQLVPKQAFICKHENTRPHLALPNKAMNYWKCELDPDISGPLKEEHKVWLPTEGNMQLYSVLMFK